MTKVVELDLRDDFEEGFWEEMEKLVVAFGRLEYIMKLALKQLSGKSFELGMAEAEGIRAFQHLCDRTLTQIRAKVPDSDTKQTALEVVCHCKELAKERNDMVHTLWTSEPNRVNRRVRPELDRKTKKLEWKKSVSIPLVGLKNLQIRIDLAHRILHDLRQGWPKIKP